ncbi:MAG TPA: hypothetical protein VFZ84_13190 [Burkholderiales bacterium]
MLALLALFAGGTAFAQSEGAKDNEGPAKTDALVPRVTYRSAFEGYRSYREQQVAPWKEVNEEVARVGGHMGVLKADRQAGPAASPAGGPTGERR